MTTIIQVSMNLSSINISQSQIWKNPTCYSYLTGPEFGPFQQKSSKLGAFAGERRKLCLFEWGKYGIFVKDESLKRKNKRVVLARFNEGFGFNGGGAPGGGGNNSNNARILGNLAVAVGLTYLTMTDQLGWVLDAIVSIWLLAVIIPVVGFGAFLWWARRDMVQGTCPNCGNDFQIFKSTINDELQLCPYCSQPFAVEDDKFVRESVRFSNESTTFGQAFSDFFPGSKKGRDSSTLIVDVEAEIKDAE